VRVGVNDGYAYIVVVVMLFISLVSSWTLTEYEFSPTMDDPVEMIFGE
jgi:hypothetical protein